MSGSPRSPTLPGRNHLRHPNRSATRTEAVVRRTGRDARQWMSTRTGAEARLQAEAQLLRSRRRHRLAEHSTAFASSIPRSSAGDHQRARAHVLLGREHLHARVVDPRVEGEFLANSPTSPHGMEDSAGTRG